MMTTTTAQAQQSREKSLLDATNHAKRPASPICSVTAPAASRCAAQSLQPAQASRPLASRPLGSRPPTKHWLPQANPHGAGRRAASLPQPNQPPAAIAPRQVTNRFAPPARPRRDRNRPAADACGQVLPRNTPALLALLRARMAGIDVPPSNHCLHPLTFEMGCVARGVTCPRRDCRNCPLSC